MIFFYSQTKKKKRKKSESEEERRWTGQLQCGQVCRVSRERERLEWSIMGSTGRIVNTGWLTGWLTDWDEM